MWPLLMDLHLANQEGCLLQMHILSSFQELSAESGKLKEEGVILAWKKC